MINIKAISVNVGKALLVSALFMAMSSGVSLIYGRDGGFGPLMISFVITLIVGAFPFIFVRKVPTLTLKDGYVTIILAWLLSFIFGMLPYVLWGGEFTLVNAWFESVSGYTTTGSTILTDIEALPKSLLFWRSSTHFIGGLGVVVFLLLVMPEASPYRLKLTNMELSSLSKEGYRYQSSKVVWVITSVYLVLMVSSCLALWAAGMPFFDAINHAFSIAATGGFSTRNLSIAAFDSQAVTLVTMFFMCVAALHFGLLYAVFVTRSLKPMKNSVVKYYFATILIMTLIISWSLIHDGGYESWGKALVDSSFNVISYISTTGFANCDNAQWPWLAAVVLMFVSLHCGCSGSTTGGIKIDRLLISYKALGNEIRRRLHPSSVFQVKMGNQPLQDSTVSAVMMYIVVYILVIFASIVVMMMCGTDAADAVSGVIASVGSVDPGVGDLGSFDNYSAQIPVAKIVYTFDMFLGRLEIYPVLIVLSMMFRRDR